MKNIILCADDFALSAPISEGIVELVEMGRLSAVSCMTEGAYWQDRRNRLPLLRDRVDIGLHFNLTQAFDQPHPSLNTLLREALLGTLPLKSIEASLHDQLDRYEAVMGEAPDFIDSHQHVHQLPRLRTVLLRALARRYRHRRPWLLRIQPALQDGVGQRRKMLLNLLDWGFARRARRYGFHLAARCRGVDSPLESADFSQTIERWLREAIDGEFIICHPGKYEPRSSDVPLAIETQTDVRANELAWLASDAFGALLQQLDIRLVRFNARN
jgi:predicted glycoside hydrolase/deacetylase ChbG (UPF0249 family)